MVWTKRSRGRDAGHLAPPAQIRACAANALGSCLGYLTSKRSLLLVCGPATGARFPGPVSGACCAAPHSPWPPPLAPPLPRPADRLCSAASRLLWRGPTSPDRPSLAYGFRLPSASRVPRGAGSQEISRFPCKECQRVHGAYDHVEPVGGLAIAPAAVLPSRLTHTVGARKCAFAAQPSPRLPSPTLRPRPRGRQRMARGRCGRLRLHRMELASNTPCRPPGARGIG